MCCKLESWVANQHLEIGTEKKKQQKNVFLRNKNFIRVGKKKSVE